MKLIFILLFFASLHPLPTIAISEDRCLPLPEPVSDAIIAYGESVRGSVPKDLWLCTLGDLDSDDKPDLVVRFALEGPCYEDTEAPAGACGVVHHIYLQVFLGPKLVPTLPRKVGGKNYRYITAMKIEDQKLHAEIISWSDGSGVPACCPDHISNTTFVLSEKN